MVDIHENYRDYMPPAWLRATVERLLASLSAEHVGGLESIVLTNSSSLRKGKTGRVGGRKYRAQECRGFYHPAGSQGRAWIELVVDNTLRAFAGRRLWLNMWRDVIVGDVLYHEIGHHLHETVGSAQKGGEASADDWSRRLSEVHFEKRYGRYKPLFAIASFLLTPFMDRLLAALGRRAQRRTVA